MNQWTLTKLQYHNGFRIVLRGLRETEDPVPAVPPIHHPASILAIIFSGLPWRSPRPLQSTRGRPPSWGPVPSRSAGAGLGAAFEHKSAGFYIRNATISRGKGNRRRRQTVEVEARSAGWSFWVDAAVTSAGGGDCGTAASVGSSPPPPRPIAICCCVRSSKRNTR